MSAPLVLAIDAGTSAVKCLLVDGSGAVAARASRPLGEHHPSPGWVEQDADEIWTAVRMAVSAVMDGTDATRICAIGLSVQRESVVLWDRLSGAALSPVISWQDQRTAAFADRLRSPLVDQKVRAASGLPLDPMFSALKAAWLLDRYDPDRRRARAGEICLGTVDAWLLSRLSDAEAVIEIGNASRTQLLNVRDGRWDGYLLDLFAIPESALPRVVPSTGPFPSAKGLPPLPDGIPLLAVMGDSHAALFAHGAFTPGQVKATYGTGSSVMGLLASPETLDAGLCLTIAWQTDCPAFAAEGNIRSAGATLKWLAGILGLSPQDLADLAVGASNDGVSVVPGFGGLGAPWWDRNAVGLISGLTLATDRRAIARAAIESIPQQVTDVLDALRRSGNELHRLHADGGPTRNDGLMQMQADLAGCPVLRAADAELSALGVAHMAGLTAGIWSWQGLRDLRRKTDRFEPAMEQRQRDGERTRWHAAVARALARQ